MAGRRCDVLDVREMMRRLRLGQSERTVAKELGVSRNTVREYHERLRREGLLSAEAPIVSLEELTERLSREPVKSGPPPRLLEHSEEIRALIETPLQVRVAWQRFGEAHPETKTSYTAFRRFVRRYIQADAPRRACMRIEVAPGEEAQVDFGYAGLIPARPGETPKKTWIFVMTLSHSRHQYVELVQDQTVATWLSLHRNAFAFLGGVPRKLVLDNLKAGIIKASVTDPEAQRAYRECAEHYGFVISPCVPRTPEHKGKVERGVGYVKRSFLAGRSFVSLEEANEAAQRWVLETAGRRIHGTTQEVPLEAFEAREKAALLPLPEAPFELVEWKQVKLHPDCHVVFARAYYSAPHALVGKSLWLRATSRVVQLFYEHRLVSTHARAYRSGARVQNAADFPPEKLQYFLRHPTWCRSRAREIGPSTGAFVEQLLSDKALDHLRGAQATLRLAETYGADRLEAACRRALACDTVVFKTLRGILVRGLDREPLPDECTPPPSLPSERPTYARTFFDLFDSNPNQKGDTTPWNSSTN